MDGPKPYPVRIEGQPDTDLSRWLWVVKWWLLAIPHYLVLGFFLGGGVWLSNRAVDSRDTGWLWGSGLIGLLVLVAGFVLLFTGTYPKPMPQNQSSTRDAA